MRRRKKDPSNYDDDSLPPLYPENYDYGPEKNPIKKRRQGCVFALIGTVLLLVCGLAGYGAYQRGLESRPTPTPTFPPDNGQPPQVDAGLVFSDYAANGQRTMVYSLDGQEISAAESIPTYLPVSAAQNPLQALNAIAYPEGAFYDESSGQLVVFGPPAQAGSATARDDFLTAMRAVYSGEYPGVSIDPTGSETVQDVRYIGGTGNTHLGWVMFEADRRMKTLSMGQDNLTGASVTSSVPGFANLLDLELALGGQNQDEVRRRFWFKVPVAEIEQSPDGGGMLITALALAVDTEYLDANWQTSTSQPPDPSGQAFAAHLTDHYDEYARDFPVFAELRSMAHWTALAHWLKQSDLPIQPESWLADSPAPFGDAPLTTPAITVTQESQQGNITQTLMLWGGVDLQMTPEIRPAQAATLGRLQELKNTFKARVGVGKLEEAGSGVSFGPVASSQIQQVASVTVDLALPLAPPLQYDGHNWHLRTPHLRQEGEGETTIFLFDDPSADSPLVLTRQGQDVDTGADVFVNVDRGLWLVIYAKGYQLYFGEFDANEEFSYFENDYMVFDQDGNILINVKAGVNYEYREGFLAGIGQSGGELEITSDREGKIEQVRLAGQEVKFQYEGDALTALMDENDALIRSFTYDEQGRLASEAGSDGTIERVYRYDANDRLLFKLESGNPVLYDWREDGPLTLVSGAALTPWQNAEVRDLEDLRVMLRMRRDNVTEHMLVARQVGDKLVVTVNDRSYTVPVYMLQNPSVLRGKLASMLGQDQPGQMVLISSGDIQGVSFQSLFGNAIPLIAETVDETRIRKNIRLLRERPGIDSSTTSLVNGVPEPDETSNPVAWYDRSSKTWRSTFDQLFAQIGSTFISRSATNEQIRKALSEDLSVIIVVAHSDGREIYLPSGARFRLADLSQEEKEKIKAQTPLVILFSCETAAPLEGDTSFAQKLLEMGTRSVIAPNGILQVRDAHDILMAFLQNPLKDSNALQALMDAIKRVYTNWLIPTDEDGDRSIQFRVQNPVPIL